MRLQITVQRHALPPTKIMWSVRAQGPTNAPAASTTISQLLEEVNDIIPLEGDDWGLEDYAVEIAGFECLHFQTVESVLKEGDQVTIRPLQTNDLRQRRIGGRIQISSDGRHLFDGIAFGRPYLRKTARPDFQVPARKRRRLEPESSQLFSDDSIQEQQQLTNGEEKENDYDDSESDEDDGDFIGDEESADALSEEDAGLAADEISDSLAENALINGIGVEDDPRRGNHLNHSRHDDEVTEQGGVELPGKRSRKRKRISPSTSRGSGESVIQNSRGAKTKTVSMSKNLKASSQKVPRAGGQPASRVVATTIKASAEISETELSESESETCSSTSGSSTTGSGASSSGSSNRSGGSESDSSDYESESTSDIGTSSDSTSESGSGSESTSSSDSEVLAKRRVVSSGKSKSNSLPGKVLQDNQKAKEPSARKPEPPVVYTAPGQGSRKTRQNNERRKKRKRLVTLIARGFLKSDATFDDLKAFEEGAPAMGSDPKSSTDATFEDRKAALLQQLSGEDLNPQDVAPLNQDKIGPVEIIASSQVATTTEPPQRRAKLDLASSRRMVFGSLGLRNPKTPEEEEQLRQKLAQQGKRGEKGALNAQVTVDMAVTEAGIRPDSLTSQYTAWRNKIELSAVECEVQGKVLSAPPFPFHRHWDEQKADSYPILAGDVDGSLQSPEQNAIEDGPEVEQALQATETPDKVFQPDTAIEFPNISDFTILDPLDIGDATVGSIIAFKHLYVSKSWEPVESDFLTAYIVEVLDHGTLRMQLAQRDIQHASEPAGEPVHEHGGAFERLIMTIGDDDTEPDDGIREFTFSELIDAKLVSKSSQAQVEEQNHVPPKEPTSQSEDGKVPLVNATLSDPVNNAPQITLSTPRQEEISQMIKDAGFRSSLGSQLVMSSIENESSHSESRVADSAPRAGSPQKLRQTLASIDGAADEPLSVGLSSPRYAGRHSSSSQIPTESFDTLNNLSGHASPSPDRVDHLQTAGDGVAYPQISQLALNSSGTSTKSARAQPLASPIEAVDDGDADFQGDGFVAEGFNEDGIVDAGNEIDDEPRSLSAKSHTPWIDEEPVNERTSSAVDAGICSSQSSSGTELLQSSNPPPQKTSELPSKTPQSPSAFASFHTSDAYSTDSSLPSLSELTSTARSTRISPPPLKRKRTPTSARRGSTKSSSNRATSSVTPTPSSLSTNPKGHRTTSISQSQNPSSTLPSEQARQPSSQSQFIDLTLSSDPISAPASSSEREADRYGKGRLESRGLSPKIKISSSQVPSEDRLEQLTEGMGEGSGKRNRALADGRWRFRARV